MSVAVIGGGWAGLAAAVTLATQDIPVTLFESAAQLGGRARRVEMNGLALDNGQHILIGAYRETLRLLETVDVDINTVFYAPPLTLQVAPSFLLRAAHLPAPWHLALGFLKSRGISLHDKLSAIGFLRALKREAFRIAPDFSVAALLAQHRQSDALNDYLWHPLCLAALNTPPHLASAQIFINVLRDAFFGTREDSRLVLPRVDLGQLLPDPAARFIAAHGFMRSVLALYTQQAAETLEFDKGEHGKPFLIHNPHLHFNLSHSQDIAMLAVATQHIGIDVECINRKNDWQKIIQRFFTESEQKKILSLDESLQQRAFFEVWTRKEAHMKVTGQGLFLAPGQFTVSVPPEPAELLALNNKQNVKQWTMFDIELPATARDYCACVSQTGHTGTLLRFLFS